MRAKKYRSPDNTVYRKEGLVKKDYTGTVFGVHTVVQHVGFNFRGKSVYECIDIFGNYYTVCSNSFKQSWFPKKLYHIESRRAKDRLKQMYNNMLRRCYNPDTKSSKWYYGEGVTVCKEWLGDYGFESFLKWAASSGYKVGMSIDKAGKEYSPETCKWVSQKDNKRYTRRTKLSVDLASQIREDWKNWSGLQKDFCLLWANKIGCGKDCIRGVLRGTRWV